MFSQSPVIALDHLFDAARIETEIGTLLQKYGHRPESTYTLNHRGEFTNPAQQLLDFPGSLDERKNKVKTVGADEYNYLHEELKGTYVEEVIATVRAQTAWAIGRIRWAALAPKSCYSLHIDADPIRFHIPIKTEARRCFFVVNEQVAHMPEPGRLYALNVQQMHTAVNSQVAAWRTHLLFDTYDPADPLKYTKMVYKEY